MSDSGNGVVRPASKTEVCRPTLTVYKMLLDAVPALMILMSPTELTLSSLYAGLFTYTRGRAQRSGK